jgi:hypothetical protein
MIMSGANSWKTFSDSRMTKVFGPVIDRLSKLEMWFSYRFIKEHRYNVVYTDLGPRYYDVDIIMEAALVKLMRRYVEDELPRWTFEFDGTGRECLIHQIEYFQTEIDNPVEGREFEADMTKPQVVGYREVLEIYDWFVIEKPKLRLDAGKYSDLWFSEIEASGHDWFADVPNSELKQFVAPTNGEASFKKSSDINKYIDDKTDEMLVRLINARGYMWT